jgi:DNA gyrase subunit B
VLTINNKFIQDFLTDLLRSRLEIWFIENKAEADRVLEQVLVNKRSRESAEKQRLNIRKKLMGSVDLVNRVKKFVDCRTRDVNRRELYIVEGDSALGSCKMGRDAEFQAIIPVRGKILNCLKADYEAIFIPATIASFPPWTWTVCAGIRSFCARMRMSTVFRSGL